MENTTKKKNRLLSLECLHCVLMQIINLADMRGLDMETGQALAGEAFRRLGAGDLSRYNSELIDEAYRVVTAHLGDEDPYREIKRSYNRSISAIAPEIARHIEKSDDPLAAAVRASIAGNLIDFAAFGNDFTLDTVLEKVRRVDREGLCLNELDALRGALGRAKTLLMLGDNCGEIVLDKLLLETIHRLYPALRLSYGVRGRASVNDATREDADEVGMAEVAEVIDNGDQCLSTLLHRTSPEFNRRFFEADLVLAKGMGNYEGLFDCARENLYFLLIAKCPVIAKMLGAPLGSCNLLYVRHDACMGGAKL